MCYLSPAVALNFQGEPAALATGGLPWDFSTVLLPPEDLEHFVLDGGHLLFYAYEAVARKPLGARVQEAGFRIGLALLAGLMLFATWNDLQKLSLFKNLGGLLS